MDLSTNTNRKFQEYKGTNMKTLSFRTLQILVLLIAVCPVFASTVTIGTGTSTQNAPIHAVYGYVRDASLYTAAEIGANGTISEIYWNNYGTTGTSYPVKIYMKTTTATTLSSSTWATMITDATLVYDGTVSGFTMNSWKKFDITDFPYTSNNLVVLVETNYGGSGNSSAPGWYYTTTGGKHENWVRSVTPPTSTGSLDTFRPNIRMIYFDPAAPATFNAVPSSFDFGNTTVVNATSAYQDVTITNNGGSPLTITNLAFTCTDSDRFLLNLNGNTDPSVTPWVLNGGQYKTIKVAFNPVDIVTYNAYLTFTHDGTDSPSNIPLTGRGCLANTITTFPYTQNFDSATFPPTGWTTSVISGTGTNLWVRSTRNHSGSTAASASVQQIATNKQAILVTPPINFPSDNYRIAFWYYRLHYLDNPNSSIYVCYNTQPNLTGATQLGTAIPVFTNSAPYEISATGWYKYYFNVPSGAVGEARYLIFNVISSDNVALTIDDVTIEQQTTPPPAKLVSPALYPLFTDASPNQVMTWTPDPSGPAPTGYYIYFGPGTNPYYIKDNGNSLTYVNSASLSANTTYSWYVSAYNAQGTCGYSPVWSFKTAAQLTANVTGQLPSNTATGVSNIGALAWSSLYGATSYDVYFGTTLPGTPTATVTTPYWIPPAMAYNTTYSWKVVGKNGFGISSGTPVVYTFTTWDDQTFDLASSSILQNFEATSPIPPLRWTSYKTDTTTSSAGTWGRSTSALHSGSASATFSAGYANGTQGLLISPRFNMPGVPCRLKFWVYRSSWYTSFEQEKIEVYFNDNPTLTGATLLSSIASNINWTPVVPAQGWYQFSFTLPGGAGTGKYVIFKGYTMAGNNQYIDDVAIEKDTPDAAIIGSPTNGATAQGPSPSFTWTAPTTGTALTGYKFYLGTNNPPTNLENGTDLGDVVSHVFESALSPGTTYYWKIVPYNGSGDCPNSVAWSFSTIPSVTGITSTPSPADGAIGVLSSSHLSWGSVANATSYDIYFGETLPSTASANVIGNAWVPSSIADFKTYFWKIVPRNAFGETSGTPAVWSFSTVNYVTGIATNPTPIDAAVNVSITQGLSWNAVDNASSYDIYFGTSLPTATSANVTGLTWTPSELLYATDYFWKIVPKNGYGETSGTPSVWTFKTADDPRITVFPHRENFDGITPPGLPNGWIQDNWYSDYSYWATTTGSGNLGSNCASLYGSYDSPMCDCLYSPPIQMTGGELYTISFDSQSMGTSPLLYLEVGPSPSWASMNYLWSNYIVDTSFTTLTVSFTPDVTGVYYFCFLGYSDSYATLLLDDIVIDHVVPTELTVPANVALNTDNSGTKISWDAVDNATSYEIDFAADPYTAQENWILYGTTNETSYLINVADRCGFFKVKAMNESSSMTKPVKNLNTQKPVDLTKKPIKVLVPRKK